MAVTSLRTKVILILPFGRFFRKLGAFSVRTIWAPESGIRFKASHVFLMRRRTWGRRNEELMYKWKRGKKLQLKENIKVEQESGKRLATKQFGNVARPCRWSAFRPIHRKKSSDLRPELYFTTFSSEGGKFLSFGIPLFGDKMPKKRKKRQQLHIDFCAFDVRRE